MITFQEVSFSYPNAAKPAVAGLSLRIPKGEFVLVAGESGSGKSTFLRCLNGLVPHFSGGTLSGRIEVAGLDPVQASPKQMSRVVGFVFQDPESQFVMDTVEDDIAFTLENAGIPPAEIGQRLENVIAQLQIERLRKRKIQTLSGGERQKAAIASAIVLSPQVLALDEPSSQLDPHAAKEILELIVQLKRKLALTVLISEHRLERLLHYADRLVYFDPDRSGAASGPPEQVLPVMSFHPPVVALGLQLGWKPLPLSVEQARPFGRSCMQQEPRMARSEVEMLEAGEGSTLDSSEPARLELDGVSVKIGAAQILEDVNLSLFKGEILALMGPNGAGKTTLLRTLVGLRKPGAGKLTLDGVDITTLRTAELCRQIGYIPQDPNLLLFAETVTDELRVTLQNHRMAVDEAWLEELLSQLHIDAQASSYPRDLSVGQRQRVALGAILVTKPGIILLDEPTRGMDLRAKQALAALLGSWRRQGKSILLVTHDVELAARCADRIAVLEAGRIVRTGPPGEVLRELGEFGPQITQLFPGTGWLTEADVQNSERRAQPNL